MSRKRGRGEATEDDLGNALAAADDNKLAAQFSERAREPPHERERTREQQGSLKLIGNRWVYRWRDPPDEQGRRRRRARTIGTLADFPTERRAWREARRLRPRLLAIAGSESPTFAFVCDLYAREALPLLADNTQRAYASDIGLRLKPAFGKLQTHEITTRRILAWMRREMRAHLEGRRRAARATRKRERDALLAVLSFANEQGFHVEPLNVAELRLPRARDPRSTVADRAYSAAERAAIAAACTEAADAHGALYAVLDDTGVRGGEALALDWSLVAPELDPDVMPVLKVRSCVGRGGTIGPPKSDAGVRDVPMGPELVARLRAYHLACGRSRGLLFPGETRTKPMTLSAAGKHLSRVLSALRIKRANRNLHGFRHSVALEHADAGMPSAMLCKLMGWSDLSSAKPYLRSSTIAPHTAVARTRAARHERETTESNDVRIFPRAANCSALPKSRVQRPQAADSVVDFRKRPDKP